MGSTRQLRVPSHSAATEPEYQANEIVFHVQSVDGPQEVARFPAVALSDCGAFWVEVAASCLGMVLSLIGVGFVGSAIKTFLLVHRAP